MAEPVSAGRRPALSTGEKSAFWDKKIVPWEASRYSALSLLNPLSWTVRRRMSEARRLMRKEFKRHSAILDLGCGSGLLAQAVLDAPERGYRGVDFSKTAIETARAHFQDHSARIRFEQLGVLDAPSWEAPLIVFLGLLDWLDEVEMCLLFKKLKAESLCFSFTEAESGFAGLLYRQYRRCSDTTYRARNFSEARIIEAAGSGGYRIDKITRFSPLDPGRLVTASKR